MANYSIKNGKTTIHSRYSKTGVLRLNHIFPNDKEVTKELLVKKLGLPKGVHLKKKYNVHDNSALVRKIFTSFLFKVLNSVADGEVFVWPGSTQANISLKPIKFNDAKLLKSKGKYKNINLLFADGKIPEFIFDFGPHIMRKDVKIYVPRDISDKAIQNAEDGKLSWQHFKKVNR